MLTEKEKALVYSLCYIGHSMNYQIQHLPTLKEHINIKYNVDDDLFNEIIDAAIEYALITGKNGEYAYQTTSILLKNNNINQYKTADELFAAIEERK